MLDAIINHQKELKKLNKKLLFLRDNFDLNYADTFYEELLDLVREFRSEIDYHFNLQIYSVGENEKVKYLVNENRLVRDILFRMLDFIKSKAIEKSMDAFLKIDDFDEILRAYLKKEKGLFRENLREKLNDEDIQEIEKKLEMLV